MTLRKRALALGLASTPLIALAGATVGTSSAQAAPPPCAGGHVCMWEDAGYLGDKWVDVAPAGFPWQYDIDGYNGDNEISSIANHSNYYIQVFTNDNASGNAVCVAPGEDMGNVPHDNDYEFFQTSAPCK